MYNEHMINDPNGASQGVCVQGGIVLKISVGAGGRVGGGGYITLRLQWPQSTLFSLLRTHFSVLLTPFSVLLTLFSVLCTPFFLFSAPLFILCFEPFSARMS